MYLELDLATLPPSLTLREADDFGSLKVVVDRVEHVHIPLATLADAAGTRANDPDWKAGLDAMVAYAREHGWTREDGSVRAHVEWKA